MPKPRKLRHIPKELLILRYLNIRMMLLDQDRKNLYNAEKGLEGEVKFDQLTEQLQSEGIVINGLLLKLDNHFFQIDTVIIFQKTIYLFDVKNYEGDYQFEAKQLRYIKTGKIIKDPFIQLQRCETMFRQLLQELGYNFNVEAFLVYINPMFTMYQAPLNPSVIFPSQVDRLMQQLNKVPSTLNGGHEKFADLLISLDLGDYPYTEQPKYEYNQLKKGVIHPCCYGFMETVNYMRLRCHTCGYEESVESAVLRSVEEFKILFPDRKITTPAIHEWCKVVKSRRTIRRILQKYYHPCGKGRYCYYE